MSGSPFHLGLFLQGSSVQAWGEAWTGHIGDSWMVPDLFLDVARSLERACFDYILLEDSSYIGESYGNSREVYLRNGLAVPRQDPSVVATLMIAATSRIGIVPTFATFAYPPYLLARLMASLDQVSSGRAGWNMVTGSSDFAARNFGLDGLPDHDLRYDMADEYMDLVTQLWNSWEPSAFITDPESGVLIDHTKVHTDRFRRSLLQIPWAPELGPLSAGQAGDCPGGRLAARPRPLPRAMPTRSSPRPRGWMMKAYRDDVRGRIAAQGRDPDRCKVLFLVSPLIAETAEDAKRLQERRKAQVAMQA